MKNIVYHVNGGTLEKVNGLNIEILSHNFHNPNCNIVSSYFDNGNGIIELTYYKSLDGSYEGHEFYSIPYGKLHHIYSRNYKTNPPKKYIEICEALKKIYLLIDFNQYEARQCEA